MIFSITYICLAIIFSTILTMLFFDFESPFQICTVIGWLYSLSYLILMFCILFRYFFICVSKMGFTSKNLLFLICTENFFFNVTILM